MALEKHRACAETVRLCLSVADPVHWQWLPNTVITVTLDQIVTLWRSGESAWDLEHAQGRKGSCMLKYVIPLIRDARDVGEGWARLGGVLPCQAIKNAEIPIRGGQGQDSQVVATNPRGKKESLFLFLSVTRSVSEASLLLPVPASRCVVPHFCPLLRSSLY